MRPLPITIPLLATALLMALMVGLATPQPTLAQCSCEASGAADVEAAPAAALATILGRAEDLWVADVTTDVKGNLPDQVSIRSRDNHQCELQWLAGRDVAVLLQVGDDGVLEAGGCSEVGASLLTDWEPANGSAGPVGAISAGRWADYRVMATGPNGEPRAFGYEDGEVTALSFCPDSEILAEAVEHEGSTELAWRSISDFSISGTIELTGPASEISCLDGSSRETVVNVDGELTLASPGGSEPFDDEWPGQLGGTTTAQPPALAATLPVPTLAALPDGSVSVEQVPPRPDPEELDLNEPPKIGEWSGWLFVIAAAGGVAYLFKKAQDPEWRSSWMKPDNGRNSNGGRRREHTNNQGHFGR